MDIIKQLDEHEKRIHDLEIGPIDLLKLLKGERVKVKFPRRYVVMWAMSLIFGIFRTSAITLIERIKLFMEGDEMIGLDLLSMIRPEYITIAIGLSAIGFVLKELVPKLRNNYIPLILLAVSFVSCSLWGYGSSVYKTTGGSSLWIDAILFCGVIHGAIVWAIAAGGWDLFHGMAKKKKKEE